MNSASVAMWAVVGMSAGLLMTPVTTCVANRYRQGGIGPVWLAIITAVAFGAVATRNPTMTELITYSVFAAVGVQLAAIDAVTQTLPRSLIWPTWVTVSCLFGFGAVIEGGGTRLLWAAAGSATLVGFYLTIAFASHGGVGAGDVRAAALVGSLLGWHSLPSVLIGTVLACLFTGTMAAALNVVRRERQSAVPHGPGLLVGAFLVLLL